MSNNKEIKIDVHHLTRVEGHGNITVHILDGEVKQVQFSVVEAPRFFEVIVRGMLFDEVMHIAPRICGLCSVSHKCSALKATEEVFGVAISPQTNLMRRLAIHGETLSSHIVHIFLLAAPDFLGFPSAFALMKKDAKVVARAFSLKKMAYDFCAAVLGRHTHPVGMKVGGFSFLQSEEALVKIRQQMVEAINDLRESAKLLKTFQLPAFERETLYVSLRHPDHYALYDGNVYCSGEGELSPKEYHSRIKEEVKSHSSAKYALWSGSSYMVGALARFNNNSAQLSPLAQELAQELGLKAPSYNPFAITLAQFVECAHCIEDSIAILDQLLNRGLDSDATLSEFSPKKGKGVGAVEAPRGLLFHEYEYDGAGLCISANQVIPTAQNQANIAADLHEYTPMIKRMNAKIIKNRLEMLVRAYDPCISCSTHVIDLAVL